MVEGEELLRHDERIAVDVETAAWLVGLSRGTLYPLLMCGEVPSFKVGRRRLVWVAGLRAWAAEQVPGRDAAAAPPVSRVW